MSLMTLSAEGFVTSIFCLIVVPLKGYDDPEILRSQLAQFCLIGADAEQAFFPLRRCVVDWDNIRVFLAVARSGQMLAAANRLAMDHATVRRRINALESTLAPSCSTGRRPAAT